MFTSKGRDGAGGTGLEGGQGFQFAICRIISLKVVEDAEWV